MRRCAKQCGLVKWAFLPNQGGKRYRAIKVSTCCAMLSAPTSGDVDVIDLLHHTVVRKVRGVLVVVSVFSNRNSCASQLVMVGETNKQYHQPLKAGSPHDARRRLRALLAHGTITPPATPDAGIVRCVQFLRDLEVGLFPSE